MKTVVELSQEGACLCRKTLLANQTLKVGSSLYADLICADPTVSELHAEVELQDAGCFLRDLNSEFGTFVNGVQVAWSTICPGDEVKIGGTGLTLSLSGNSIVAEQRQQRLRTHPAFRGRGRSIELRYTESTAGPLKLFKGSVENGDQWEVVLPLTQHRPLHLLVNLRQAGVPLPARLGHINELLGTSNVNDSLHLLPESESGDQLTSLHHGWRNGWVVAFNANEDCGVVERVAKASAAVWVKREMLHQVLETRPTFLAQYVKLVSSIALPTQDGWTVIADRRTSWRSLGFPKPPT